MPILTLADLKPGPGVYPSPRKLWDVLVGDDLALPLTEASSDGDIVALEVLLSDPAWIKIATEEQHTIYDNFDKDASTGEARVLAMPYTNLQRVVLKTAINGHAEAVSMLLDFATQKCGLKPSDALTYWTVSQTVRAGQAAVLDVLIRADPEIVTQEMKYSGLPLDEAVNRRKWGVVTVLLEHGAEGTRMAELLLVQQHFAVGGSGALHSAAELGRLDVMSLLLQHGADVNEVLPEQGLIKVKDEDRTLYASWPPMHFAAAKGEVEAMQLLRTAGAREEARDLEGRTAIEVLEGRAAGKDA
ncbi:hypothetical protein LTR95_016658 [Oleoguttula sp. CCFEE 5521]